MNEIKNYTEKLFEDINILMKMVMNTGMQESCNLH